MVARPDIPERTGGVPQRYQVSHKYRVLQSYKSLSGVSNAQRHIESPPTCLYTCLPLRLYASVCSFLCLSTRPCVDSPVCLHVRLTIRLPVCLPVCLAVCLPVCLHVRLTIRLPVCLPVCLAVCLPVCLHIRLTIRLPVCLPVCLHVRVSTRLSVYTSV